MQEADYHLQPIPATNPVDVGALDNALLFQEICALLRARREASVLAYARHNSPKLANQPRDSQVAARKRTRAKTILGPDGFTFDCYHGPIHHRSRAAENWESERNEAARNE